MSSNLLIDFLHVQSLRSGAEVSQRTLVSCIFAVEVILLGRDKALCAAAGVRRLTDCAGLGGGGFIGSPLSITRLVVGAADAVIRT